MITKTYKRLAIFIVIVAILIGVGWYFSRPKPIPVTVAKVERSDVESTVSNTRSGTVKACRRAGLSPAVSGQIAKLPVNEGGEVKAGELLLELWNDDLQAQMRLAEQQYRSSRAQAEAACLQADVADRDAQRLVKLQKSGATSEEQIDQAVTKAKASHAQCDAAKKQTRVSSAQMDVVATDLARTLLIAPFDGVVAKINGEVGEFVTPSPPGIPTLPVIDLVDTSCFYVVAPIDEVDAPNIKPGMPARITLDAFPQQHFDGKVRRVSDFVLEREKQARTVDVDVEFVRDKRLPALLAGYSADAEIILSSHKNVLRIPTLAVMAGPRVLIYAPDGNTLQLRNIKTGISNWDYTEILDGLKEGEDVVTSLDRQGVEDGAYAIPETEKK